jgi:hypothetical protein
MLRNIGAVAAGVVAGAIVIFIVEGAGHMIFPPPDGVNLKDPAALAGIMESIPLGAKIAVLVAWFAGILAGGSAALYIGRRWAPVAWVVAAALFGMAAVTMIQIPHPLWMMIGAVVATLAGAFGAIKLFHGTYAPPLAAKSSAS